MECECHCLLWYPLGLLTTGPDQPLGPPPWPRPIAFTSNVVFGGQACKPGPRVPSREPGRIHLSSNTPGSYQAWCMTLSQGDRRTSEGIWPRSELAAG